MKTNVAECDGKLSGQVSELRAVLETRRVMRVCLRKLNFNPSGTRVSVHFAQAVGAESDMCRCGNHDHQQVAGVDNANLISKILKWILS